MMNNKYNLRGDKMNKKNNEVENNTLDFEKMNATLANPEFANWYYNQMMNKNDSNVTIDDFVQVVKDYTQNHYE